MINIGWVQPMVGGNARSTGLLLAYALKAGQLVAEGTPSQADKPCGFGGVVVGRLHRPGDEHSLDVLKRDGATLEVDLNRLGRDPGSLTDRASHEEHGKVFNMERPAVGQKDGSLQAVGQLSNISGPVVAPQTFQEQIIGLVNRSTKLPAEGPHEMPCQEIDVIAPVIRELRDTGLNLSDPLPADTLFNPERLKHYDAVLAMYHDQGLPVLKYASFGAGVNVTLGLPIIRTSVDHGTALDIAGTGQADAGSLIEAVKLAIELAHLRTRA